jgi:hypothetical protein
MSQTAAPFGLRPSYHPSGTLRPEASTILTGYASNLLQYQPVKIVPAATGEGTLAAAAVGDRIMGTFMGVEWTDTDGRRRVSNKWTGNTPGTDIVAYFTMDPNIVYEMQSNAPLNQIDVGKQFMFTPASGSVVTGLSSQALDVASAAANATFRFLGITPGPDNAYGDPFVIARVQISQHQNVADIAAF